MKKFLLAFSLCLTLTGCNALNHALNTVAPNRIDPLTNTEIVGTHTPTAITQDAATAVPYGPAVLTFLLLIINFVQKAQNKKLDDGLTSTIQAIEAAGNDPDIATSIAILKEKLAHAHQIADVQPLINDILAKLKLLPPTTQQNA